jgi:protein-L-isoaspartate(D-aspartate) O-methyltransferase
MSEEYSFRQRRNQLIEELRNKGIRDERVLAAIAAVPRHLFIEPALRPRAYMDEALPIGLNQTISQPFTVAYQTMLLAPMKDDRILEIGTGSGYQAAVLCELGARVFSVERHKPLLDRTQALLMSMGYRVVTRHGDGSLGWPAFAPYDGILVTAGATDIPQPLLDQLRVPEPELGGGRLVIPVGDANSQTMNRITCIGPGEYEREETHSFRFVPLIGGVGPPGNGQPTRR